MPMQEVTKEITLSQLTLTGSDAANYKLVQPDSAVALTSDVVISKAAVAPNMPGNMISAANSKEKVKDITLPENWNWKESDLEKRTGSRCCCYGNRRV